MFLNLSTHSSDNSQITQYNMRLLRKSFHGTIGDKRRGYSQFHSLLAQQFAQSDGCLVIATTAVK